MRPQTRQPSQPTKRCPSCLAVLPKRQDGWWTGWADWKGCRETVEDGRNGFLVKPNDTKSLVAAFEAVAKKEADELLLMGRNSRELAERRFDERVVLDAYLGALGEE